MPASISDYETLRELGNGGQGTVTLVKEKNSNPPRLFACKQIACTSQQILDNAVSEIKVLLKLNHPHIIRYEDFFITIEEPSPTTADPNNRRRSYYSIADWTNQQQQQQQQQKAVGTVTAVTTASSSFTAVVYLLTEYCESGDLSQLIRRIKNEFMDSGRHSIPEAKVLEWLEQCCDALDAIHNKLKFMHQDMKTSNCFVTRDGAIKLGDFGLAAPIVAPGSPLMQHKSSSSSGTAGGGTPAYLAPEQLQRTSQQQPLTAAIDVWGLGTTFCELLTLQQDRSINVLVLQQPVEALEKVVKEITNLRFSRPLALLVRDMLQRRPEDRPTPVEIIQRVQQIRAAASSSSSMSAAAVGGDALLSRGPSPVVVPSLPPHPPTSSASGTFPLLASRQQQQLQQQQQQRSSTTPTLPAGTKCSICDVFDAVVVCQACNDEPLCRSCDQMKHRSTQRQGHVRTPVQISVVAGGAMNHNSNNNGNGNQLLQQQQLESCPSSVGSSFDGGLPQIPPAPMAAFDFDTLHGNNNNCNWVPSTSGRGAGAATSSSRSSLTPVDPNQLQQAHQQSASSSRLVGNCNNNNNNNNNAAVVKPLVPLAKPTPLFSSALAMNRGLPSSNSNGSSNPVTPTSALSIQPQQVSSGSFNRPPTSGRGSNPPPSAASTSKAASTFPCKPLPHQQQPDRSLSPFNTISPSMLAQHPEQPQQQQQQQQYNAAAPLGGFTSASSSRFSPMVLAGPPRPVLEVPSAQYPTIAAALLKAESGSRIVVSGSGIYCEPLEFTRPDVEVVGNPPSNSNNSAGGGGGSTTSRPTIEVRGAGVGAAVRISEVSRIKLCNLNIVHAGGAGGGKISPPLAAADDAAASSSEPKQFAVLIADAAGAVIENCGIISEFGSGIGVAGPLSDPLISACTVTAHLNGVHISAGATGTVYRTVIRGTSLAAILVKRKAAPRLVSNTLENNKQAGIFFFRAGGLTEKNTIVNCGGCAIVVKGGSNPTVRKNKISHCAQAGILISDESRGTICENTIQQCRKTSILIKTGAAPVVQRNHISRGQEAGIYVFENGGGRIEENEIVDNGNAGIIVTTGGNPVVVGNRVLRNTYEGIWVCNEGSGRFEKNVLEGNGRRGAVDIQSGCRVEWIA